MADDYRVNKSILIVDDNAMNLKLLQEILKKDYKVFPAPSGERALAFLEKATPGLILLDLEMPGLNGYDVIQRLKNEPRWKEIPVIFLTAQESRAMEEKAFQMGAVDYIHKPISSGIVKKRVGLQLELQGYQKNLEHLVEMSTIKLQRTQDTILEILANVTAFRDNETGNHIHRTTWYTRKIMNALVQHNYPGYIMDPDYAANTIKSAKLHDIGKVAISDAILLKPGKLTPEEFSIMKQHATLGAQMIDLAMHELGDTSDFLLVAKEIVYNHHEWWNGKGYPRGIKGENIPLSGRVMAISDVYDALVSARPYKEPYSHERAVEILWEEAGTHLDPLLMELIEEVLPCFPEAVEVYQDKVESVL
jgi:putative two-component system response regulator